MFPSCHRVNCTVRREDETCSSSCITSSSTFDRVKMYSTRLAKSERRHNSNNLMKVNSSSSAHLSSWTDDKKYKCIKSYNCYLCTIFVYLLLLIKSIDGNVMVTEKSISRATDNSESMQQYQLPKMLNASIIETLLHAESGDNVASADETSILHTSSSYEETGASSPAPSSSPLTFERLSSTARDVIERDEEKKVSTASTTFLQDKTINARSKCISCDVQLNQPNSQLNFKSHHPLNEEHRQLTHQLTHSGASDSTATAAAATAAAAITRINSTFATTFNQSKFVYLNFALHLSPSPAVH